MTRLRGVGMGREPVQVIAMDAEAGQVSAELARHGVPPDARVHVVVQVGEELPTAALAQAGGAFRWLEEEPDLYTDADLKERSA